VVKKAERKLLFSVTRNDFEVQTFRSGGPGGQYQNKRDSGIRIIHKASGARGEARDQRSQAQNKKAAFRRMVATPEFQTWLKVRAGEAALTEGQKELLRQRMERAVDRQMAGENLLVEHKVDGQWVVQT